MAKWLVRSRCLALAFWLCGLSALTVAWAQDDGSSRTATLLPVVATNVGQSSSNNLVIEADKSNKPTRGIYLKFDPTILPRGACVTDWTLRVYPQETGTVQQLVRVFGVTQQALVASNAPNSIGFAAINQDDISKDFNLNFKKEDQPPCSWANSQLSVVLQSQSPGLSYTYNGLADRCDQEDGKVSPCNVQPRLIVRYYMPPAAADPNWSQERYDPQQSGRTAWQVSAGSGGITLAKPNPVYQPSGHIVNGPVMYKGRLFFHTHQVEGSGSGKFFITAVDQRGKAVWGKDVDIQAAAKFSPALDREGRLYVVTENCLLVLNAEDDGKFLTSPCLTESCSSNLCNGKSLLGVKGQTSVRSTPTLGANGALYLSTNQGVFALTPYPELKVLWRFRAGGLDQSFGQVALSADETTAYVLDGAAGQLVAIDTTDGSERWRGGTFTKSDSTKSDALPVPVVEAGFVCVVNGYQQGDSLQVFEDKTCAEKAPSVCQPVATIQGSISRPVIPVITGNGKAYFVNNQSLCAWEPLKTATATPTATPTPSGLSPLSQLAADGKGNVYVMDGMSSPQRIRGYRPDFTEFLSLDVPATESVAEKKSTNFGNNLLVAADGTLYNANANTLFAFELVPENDLTVSNVAGANRTTFLAAKSLQVGKVGKNGEPEEVAVNPGQSFIFKSGCSIELKPGFKVSTGARVLMQVGFNQAVDCSKP